MPPKRKAAAQESKASASSEAASSSSSSPAKKAKSAGGKLAVGDNVSAVDVTLTTEEEKEVTLSDITKDKGVVIFMYPKANTGGCEYHG